MEGGGAFGMRRFYRPAAGATAAAREPLREQEAVKRRYPERSYNPGCYGT